MATDSDTRPLRIEMRALQADALIVLSLSVCAFGGNYLLLGSLKARFDVLAFSALFVALLLMRDSLVAPWNPDTSPALRSLGLAFAMLFVQFGLMLSLFWQREDYPASLVSLRLANWSAVSYAVACAVLLFRHIPLPLLVRISPSEDQLRTAVRRLLHIFLYLAKPLVPSLALTGLTYYFSHGTWYENTYPNHASVFAAYLAVVLLIEQALRHTQRE